MKKAVKITTLIAKICTIVFAWIAGLYTVAAPIITSTSLIVDWVNTAFKVETTEKKWEGPSSSEEDGAAKAVAYYGTEFKSIADLKETSHQVSQDVTAEGSVLLMNKSNALPLAAGSSVSLYDVTSVDPVWGGTGSGQATVTGTAGNGSPGAPDGDYNSPAYPFATSKPTFLKSLKAEGFSVNETLWNWYNTSGKRRVKTAGWPGSYNTIDGSSWSDMPDSSGKSNAADAGIFVLGRIGGEDYDRKLLDMNESGNSSKSYLQLSTKEKTVLDQLKVLRSNGTLKKLILIINSSNQPELDWLTGDAYGFDAALWVGGIGQDGIDAIAEILSGKVNPSGRLQQMYWNKHTDNPVYTNFGRFSFGTGNMTASAAGNDSSYVVYQEGMYLGYRYAETRYEDQVLGTANVGTFDYDSVVAYPFGHGLSYTTFEYSGFAVTSKNFTKKPHKTVNALNLQDFVYHAEDKNRDLNKTEYTVTVDVKNAGSKAGKETVQIYMQRPYSEYDKTNKIEKPAVELVGFAKTKMLEPGAVEKIEVKIDEKYFAVFDAYGAGTNVLTPGDYYLSTGRNAHEAINNILALKGKTAAGGTAALANKALTQAEPDTTKYKYADATGRKVENLFDAVDINRYSGRGSNSVTYISRNNWDGTVKFLSHPTGTLAQQENQVVLTKTTQMTAEMSGNRAQLAKDSIAYPTFGANNGIKLSEMASRDVDGNLIYAYDDPKWQTFLDQLSWDDLVSLLSNGKRRTRGIESVGKPETLDHNGPVGFIHKYGDRSQGDMPNNADKWSGYAGLSREGVHEDADGKLVRNDGINNPHILDPNRTAYPTAFSSNPVLAATYNIELAEKVGQMIGEDGLWGGYNGIYGTGANILRAPHQGRCFEYFSEDGLLTGYIVSYWSKGCQSKGVLVYNKHFALNEQELNRYGISTFLTEQAFREIYLRAFAIPIELGDARAMMGALNRVGVEYAPACKALFTDWLRGETGFQGFTVTDWWDNKNGEDDASPTGTSGYYMQVANTLVAGNDLPDGELNIVKLNRYKPGGSQENGRLAWAMRESAHRTCFAVADSWAVDGWTTGRWVSYPKEITWPKTALLWQKLVWIPFGISAALFITMIVLGSMIKKGKIKA